MDSAYAAMAAAKFLATRAQFAVSHGNFVYGQTEDGLPKDAQDGMNAFLEAAGYEPGVTIAEAGAQAARRGKKREGGVKDE